MGRDGRLQRSPGVLGRERLPAREPKGHSLLIDSRMARGEENPMADDIILSTAGLTKDFGGFTAVSGVDLKVRRGPFTH
jgi:hypothetical protein